VTASFALKPGRVTILRLGDDQGHLRALATTGQALETETDIRGVVSHVRFDGSAADFLDEVLANGWEHHLVLAYGDVMPSLAMLCRTLQVPLTVAR
jgi:L-fucose isomerase-like protein